jgi:hypothetical protein
VKINKEILDILTNPELDICHLEVMDDLGRTLIMITAQIDKEEKDES